MVRERIIGESDARIYVLVCRVAGEYMGNVRKAGRGGKIGDCIKVVMQGVRIGHKLPSQTQSHRQLRRNFPFVLNIGEVFGLPIISIEVSTTRAYYYKRLTREELGETVEGPF